MPDITERHTGVLNLTKQELAQAKQYVKHHYPLFLFELTPEGVEAKIDSEVTDLASAKAALKILAKAICINTKAIKYLVEHLT